MEVIDAFNGDADGICALHQWRMATPASRASLVTGVKRDISLLERVHAHDADVTVFDVSFDKNRDNVERLLQNGCHVTYVDHHFAGDIPDHPELIVHIDPSFDVCASLIVNRLLHGRFKTWAAVGAFGDNLHQEAEGVCRDAEVSDDGIKILAEIGELLNYNAYGWEELDLHIHPAELYQEVHRFEDPFVFAENAPAFTRLRDGYASDREKASGVQIERVPAGRVISFPDTPWARRISGVFANEKAREEPSHAHALLTSCPGGGYRVSVRAPLATGTGAATLCRGFATGGGREKAAGINLLPKNHVDDFIHAFNQTFSPTT